MINEARLDTIDAVRGFAVCGILVMNIVAMGMPGYAYVDPTCYGGAHGADLAAWGIAYVLVDGKMRALFTMLFGASLLIVTDAAEDRTPGPARTHYARMGWLLAFGMLHAWFIWYGDILVEYAVVGAIAFIARKWPPRALAYSAVLLIGWDVAHDLILWRDMTLLRHLATMPQAPADAVVAWNTMHDAIVPNQAAVMKELQSYRGGIVDVFAARAETTRLFQFSYLPGWVPGTLGIAAFGMWLYRIGFWRAGWSARAYCWLLAGGAVPLLLYLPLVRAIVTHEFDPAFLPLADALSLMLRLPLALAYAAAIILLVRSGRGDWGMRRLAAAGRMAFSNYLATSLIMTTIFYGYGFELFGRFSRAELYLPVLLQWTLILGWSLPWLNRFRYGPFEWAWRSLARGELQPMRKSIAKQSQ